MHHTNTHNRQTTDTQQTDNRHTTDITDTTNKTDERQPCTPEQLVVASLEDVFPAHAFE